MFNAYDRMSSGHSHNQKLKKYIFHHVWTNCLKIKPSSPNALYTTQNDRTQSIKQPIELTNVRNTALTYTTATLKLLSCGIIRNGSVQFFLLRSKTNY
jgi:hypothetical protein